MRKEPFSEREYDAYKEKVINKLRIKQDEIDYFVFLGTVSNHAYSKEKEPICILQKNGEIKDLVQVSDHFNLAALTKPVVKHFVAFPKV